MTAADLVLVGAGGHASDVLGAVEDINRERPTFTVVGIVADDVPDKRRFEGRATYLGPVEVVHDLDAVLVLTVGWPSTRRQLFDKVRGATRQFATIIHPHARLGTGVEVGDGTVVLAGACCSPLVRLGRHVLVSYQAVIGHDAVIGDFSSIMPAAAVSGDVVVGDGVTIGTTATVIEGLTIGDDAVLAAGAVAVEHVAASTRVRGVPARPF